ncbi:hypothetical protein M6B38_185240 [Iris pallida]|uniref:Uncharacterized protein n=1 Tax=Iris pallida TaxID=29817 RepID=A0AAX6ELE8_IRIPA|nr:hypothetical protein M6B38_185240 [Iris pallida]
MHRVESIRNAALPRRISALRRLEDSKKSNRPREQVRIDASIDFSWFHVQAIRLRCNIRGRHFALFSKGSAKLNRRLATD